MKRGRTAQPSVAPSEAQTSYRRGQVEWALWRWFADPQGEEPPPKPFLTRIKRLLEIDRSDNVPRGAETVPVVRFAFIDQAPANKGSDVGFSAFNAFCLAFGLDMLDAGFNQSEVVFVLRYIRNDLDREYKRALERPPLPRTFRLAEEMPDVPSFHEKGVTYADPRIFMVLQKVELVERFPTWKAKGANQAPLILKPIFKRGIETLRNELHELGYNNRRALVFEIAHTAVIVTDLLKKAPEIKRGRPPAN
jgi:hypothetical protein